MRFKRKDPEIAEVDMTPMIDIVFQLIAFFMVITNFEQTKADERVKLPTDQLAKPPEQRREHQVVLNIGFNRTKSGKITSGVLVFFNGDQIPIDSFGQSLKTEREVYKTKGVDISDVFVIIRGDAEVKTGQIQEVIKKAQENGFEKFSLSATKEE